MQSSMVTSGAVSQRLDRLGAAGLVTRTRSEDGRPRSSRSPSPRRACALIDQALPAHVANEHRLLAALDPAARTEVASTLRTLLLSLGDAT